KSSDPMIAEVTDVGVGPGGLFGRGVVTAHAPGTAEVTAGFQGLLAASHVEVGKSMLISLRISPTDPLLRAGETQPFQAIGTFADGGSRDVTSGATWESSRSDVAVISNGGGSRGIATALGGGQTRISASFAGLSGSTTLTVAGA